MPKKQPRTAVAKKDGRPAGSRNRRYDTVRILPSRCAKCGSTRRTRYTHTRRQPYPGLAHGEPYTHIARRRTTCADCGQARVDLAYENHPTDPPIVLSGDDAEQDAPNDDD